MFANPFSNSRFNPRILRIGAKFLFVLIVSSLSASTLAQSTQNIPELVHHGDIIDVDVIGGFEFDWRGKLTTEGFLDGLNSFGDPVYGLCRSEAEIADHVAKAYSKTLRDPKVKVKIIDRSNRALVLLDGAVKMPQRFQLNRPASLRELIVMSGGISDDASGEIQIFRPASLSCPQTKSKGTGGGNAIQTVNIAIKDLLSGAVKANPIVASGDLITVSRADVIYVVGGVGAPRQIAARTQTTLSRAIAAAGGLSESVAESVVTIYRRVNGETESIKTDLQKIATGETVDPSLKAFDIIEVPLKGSKKRKFPPVLVRSANAVRVLPPLRIVD